jgi:ATP-dependent Clp protease ATP-binding subunit ClpC
MIAQARGRGELEGLLSQLLSEAFAAKNIILFLDNAELFFSDGTGAVDVRNVLLPVLENGGMQIVMSMDEQQWLKLSRATPALTQQLNRISVPPLNEADTLLVCQDHLLATEFQAKVTYMYQALKSAYRLGSRYVADQSMPGQALHILEAAAQYAERGLVTSASVEQAVEKLYGVKVATARRTEERQTLLNLEQLLHERMINQTRAVSAVANALRRARSGVRNQNRPIGSFLFLGPTGVGKTELAKALAAVYFGGEDHMVRLDLNEFGTADAVGRLIADAATDPRSLTAQIAKQPFSVVLLDEIEKAHPTVLDTLLQLLDEGILRDVSNREISFRDAVVIATSNAGSDQIRKYIAAGQELEQFEEQFMDQLIDSGQFKPEFLNRFDETTIFRPLTESELLQVVDLLLKAVNKTLEQQHIQVAVADDAKQELVRVGNDPRLGARPMRRIVQRTVENIVAKRLLENQVAPGTTIQLSLTEVEEALQNESKV